jgi:NAD(P)-dependent dehydrogenase (short-subunit alcohol dehydrogenase family)
MLSLAKIAQLPFPALNGAFDALYRPGQQWYWKVGLRRIGTPEDVAAAVSFFASEAAGLITGRRLVIDGRRGLG